MTKRIKPYALALLIFLALPHSISADVAEESYGQLTLQDIPVHAVLVNTFNGRAVLFDADSERMLGMLSLGFGANAVEVDRSKGVVHVAETYFSRHSRGVRTDVVTTYELKTLSAINEIVIPPKHATGSPKRHYSGVLRDDTGSELMLVTNITPAVSVSVVDLKKGKFLQEINTAGCGLVYPVRELRTWRGARLL